ncbi:STAS domain-containing protein [Jannaschia rubra]|nr:STAS domain-containing protein [Jannaschia rubra]
MTDQGGDIALPERLDIAAAATLRKVLLGCDGDIVLDARNVRLLTTPCLQVLMAGRDRQRTLGRGLTVANPSPAFSSCATTLGVTLDRLQTPARAA